MDATKGLLKIQCVGLKTIAKVGSECEHTHAPSCAGVVVGGSDQADPVLRANLWPPLCLPTPPQPGNIHLTSSQGLHVTVLGAVFLGRNGALACLNGPDPADQTPS